MIEKYQGYTEKRVKLQGFRPVGKHPFKIIHNARAVKYDLIQQFEALYNGDDLLAVTPQFDDISSLEAVSILLNVLIADARQCTDIEDFIKTIISMWGTYDETEENS